MSTKFIVANLNTSCTFIRCIHYIQAVTHLHRRNICHRDIKPANVLLAHTTFPTTQATNTQTTHTTHTHTTRPYKLILCDFGSAEQFDAHTNPAGLVSNTTGSPADWAPEMVFPDKYETDVGLDLASEIPEIVTEERGDSKGVSEIYDSGDVNSTNVHRFSAYGLDMWAVGVVLFEMFYMKHPFYRAELNEVELYERIDSYDPMMCTPLKTESTVDMNNKYTTNVQPPSAACISILEGLLQKEPTMRWSIDTLLEVDLFV